jgi:LuxR family maltose regulon positive regulatory protein
VERFIEQNYMELVSRGEQAWIRYWTGTLSKELVVRRPLLCIYEASSHAWFGELDEADQLLEAAETQIRAGISAPDARSMQALHVYVKSRVTAMRGDIRRAIELCLEASQLAPADNLAMQMDTRITLGLEYFVAGDYAHASQILGETIRLGTAAGAVINTVAAACILARLVAVQGLLIKSYDIYQMAMQCIPGGSGQHLGARALVEIGVAELLCEWNDLDGALARVEQGLALLPWWGKADDWALAYVTLERIHLAQANNSEAKAATAKAINAIQTSGVFSEARHAVEAAQVRLWLAVGDWQAANRWAASRQDGFEFEKELANIAQARVLIAQNRHEETIALLSRLEKAARSAGRMGRVIEILLLQALAMHKTGDSEHALLALTECLALAEPEGYVRIFLDEGRPMRMLLAQWLAHCHGRSGQDYAKRLLSQFDDEQPAITAPPELHVDDRPVERLSERELEVLHLMALGRSNQEIAQQLIVALGTTKAHAASIYRKLDVTNRTEAVARARQLGILP